MKFHFGGKYSTDEDLKAKREHHQGSVPFKEPGKNMFALIADAQRSGDVS